MWLQPWLSRLSRVQKRLLHEVAAQHRAVCRPITAREFPIIHPKWLSVFPRPLAGLRKPWLPQDL